MIVTPYGYNPQGLAIPPILSNEPETSEGGTADWILENGGDVLSILEQVRCAINPTRPGCPGDPNSQPVIVQNGPPSEILYALGAIVILLLLVLIFKK
jgi:hypothetical protein